MATSQGLDWDQKVSVYVSKFRWFQCLKGRFPTSYFVSLEVEIVYLSQWIKNSYVYITNLSVKRTMFIQYSSLYMSHLILSLLIYLVIESWQSSSHRHHAFTIRSSHILLATDIFSWHKIILKIIITQGNDNSKSFNELVTYDSSSHHASRTYDVSAV